MNNKLCIKVGKWNNSLLRCTIKKNIKILWCVCEDASLCYFSVVYFTTLSASLTARYPVFGKLKMMNWKVAMAVQLRYCIHFVFSLTGLEPLPVRVLQTARFSASLSKVQYVLFPLESSSIYLCLLPRLLVPFIFPSTTCFRRQFISKMWPVQLAFLRFILCVFS